MAGLTAADEPGSKRLSLSECASAREGTRQPG
jgi:hypothetical protein